MLLGDGHLLCIPARAHPGLLTLPTGRVDAEGPG